MKNIFSLFCMLLLLNTPAITLNMGAGFGDKGIDAKSKSVSRDKKALNKKLVEIIRGRYSSASEQANQADKVKEILDQGADPNALIGGCNIIHEAVYSGNHLVVEHLINAGANVNFHANAAHGNRTPLMVALSIELMMKC